MNPQMKVFAGQSSKELGEAVCRHLGVSLGNAEFTKFSDGEFQVSYEETVRGQDVFIVQSTFMPTDNLFELLLMVDAAKRASAKSIVAVIPYFGFARQDRKDKPRVAIGSKLVANMLSVAGIDRLMTMELHADQIQGFFEIPVDHLYSSSIFLPYLKNWAEKENKDIVIAAPDVGGAKRAQVYAKHLNCGLALCHKDRKKANEVGSMTVIGEVEGKDVVIVDDIVDTAGTLTKAADLYHEKGARSVIAICTHAVLSGPAYQRLEDSKLNKLIVTDTIPLKQNHNKIEVLSVAPLFSDVITALLHNKSINKHFIL
jgi:ribose-phosphate pyrophosphokinase